jgi:ATP-dependent Clp protease ATP-binding subunit ClpA
MDHGKLTDHNGKQVNFQNVILIMTTNAGAGDLAKPAVGFSRTKREGDDEEAIKKLFTPEFRNRLDAVIGFQNLPKNVITKVIEKFVFQLEAQLADHSVTIELSPEALEWLIERGYDEQFGARPLGRVIQEHIKKPLAEELLFGKLEGGGTVRVVVKTKEKKKVLDLQILEVPEKPKSRDPESEEESGNPEAKVEAEETETKSKRSRGRKSKKSGGGGSDKASLVPKVPLS